MTSERSVKDVSREELRTEATYESFRDNKDTLDQADSFEAIIRRNVVLMLLSADWLQTEIENTSFET